MPRILMILPLILSLCLAGCSAPLKDESATEAAAPEGEKPSLYSRLGGEPTLKAFADQFVQQLALNNTIMKNPIVAGAMSKPHKNHKEKLATLLCQITGGPCKYEGRSVKDAHGTLKITQNEWKEMTRVFIQVLKKMKVPKRERTELARLVAKYKNQIVGS